MIEVRTASRLHFGLLLPGGMAPDATPSPLPRRQFGSVGLMVEEPGILLTARRAKDWHAEGPLAERVLTFARHFQASEPALHFETAAFVTSQASPEHLGLGTGTQLALAVGTAMLALTPGPHAAMPAEELARRLGRGGRSAIGIHGFFHGGFIVDGGRPPAGTLAPLVARTDFPESWRVLLLLPGRLPRTFGDREREAFASLRRNPPRNDVTDRLCRLVLLSMLPALAERDLPAFGDAVFEFNRRVGDAFAVVQGGPYSHPQVAAIVEFLRRQGTAGAGQSSWGPGVFAFVEGEDAARHLAAQAAARFGLLPEEVVITSACNHGAAVRCGEAARAGEAHLGEVTGLP